MLNSNINKALEINSNKAVLLSIKKQWLEKILSGEKTIEVRKTMPWEISYPFVVFCYETKANGGAGKVTAAFVCRDINTLDCLRELPAYTLSAYMPENPYAVHEKNAWLDAYLPEIDSERRIFVACGSSKARAAANRLKTPCIDNSFVLLDDYSVNLHEWKANRGSCIKLRNGINGNGGTWKGESVTRFDTAENIADRIWSIIKKQMQCEISKLLQVGN